MLGEVEGVVRMQVVERRKRRRRRKAEKEDASGWTKQQRGARKLAAGYSAKLKVMVYNENQVKDIACPLSVRPSQLKTISAKHSRRVAESAIRSISQCRPVLPGCYVLLIVDLPRVARTLVPWRVAASCATSASEGGVSFGALCCRVALAFAAVLAAFSRCCL